MNTRTREQQINFLMDNCGSTIKHLLLLQSNDTENKEFKENHTELLGLPIVSHWKSNIPTQLTYSTILGSSDTCFENSFGKLLSFGLSVNDIISRKILHNYISFIKERKVNDIHGWLARYIVAGYLYITDCSHEVIKEIINKRIDTLYSFISTSSIKHNIYVAGPDFGVPHQYRSKKIVNPLLYENKELVLPLIHDVFVFSHLYDKFSLEQKKKIDVIVNYIADDKYQSMDYGYGIIKSPQNRYHFMGWSAHLPLFNENLSNDYFIKGLIYRMVLFSKFRNREIQRWINEMLKKLEEFKLDDFRYCFSNDLLPEVKNSYFMNGRHMGLNENRRKKNGRTIESTFYIHLCMGNMGCFRSGTQCIP